MIEINNTTRGAIDEKFLIKTAKKVLSKEKTKKAGLSIALVGPKRMQELNKIYRGKDKVANVLSFPFDSAQGRSEPELGLGEIVICPAQVRKDAKKYGILFKEALAWMVIHGILHLVGYNHERGQKEAEKMEKREEYYLSLTHKQQ